LKREQNPCLRGSIWEPMRLDHVGQIGSLMRAATGSRQDSGEANCGGHGRQHLTGKVCPP